mgnify:FL=1
MQHIYALSFAGVITAIIAAIILYTDYGFWHQRYIREEATTDIAVAETVAESPGKVLSRFWNEARTQFSNISSVSSGLLEGKESYQSTDNR